jgi:hypothetical protein
VISTAFAPPARPSTCNLRDVVPVPPGASSRLVGPTGSIVLGGTRRYETESMIRQLDGPHEENTAPVPVQTSHGPAGTAASGIDPSTDSGPTRTRRTGRILALCIAVGLVFAAAYGVGVAGTGNPASSASSSAAGTSSSSPGASHGPAAATSSLSALLVQPRDTTGSLSEHLLPGGDQVDGQPTLDLCNGRFPSESLRTARLQDVAVDVSGTPILSTEAVLYRNAAATRQAFAELRNVTASCPTGPVPGPVSGSTITTTLHKPPDGSWPTTASVEREAFSLTTADQSGASADTVAVYLRRGRVLLGMYFSKPNAEQPAIDGATNLAGIVTAFATRIARLPASFVADPAR